MTDFTVAQFSHSRSLKLVIASSSIYIAKQMQKWGDVCVHSCSTSKGDSVEWSRTEQVPSNAPF